ncbi:hypothetical protein Vqi01_26140 [Micromonospora qiuiae]|uniref:Uncharacterized protein n=1 Tax=Micromonospora qiuiae TaxID=502268 RepID=A0ABQ4JBI7_9ACTN|nr:hypothetical protein Vqi01_26140 [Micromonospora qiuiae]
MPTKTMSTYGQGAGTRASSRRIRPVPTIRPPTVPASNRCRVPAPEPITPAAAGDICGRSGNRPTVLADGRTEAAEAWATNTAPW